MNNNHSMKREYQIKGKGHPTAGHKGPNEEQK